MAGTLKCCGLTFQVTDYQWEGQKSIKGFQPVASMDEKEAEEFAVYIERDPTEKAKLPLPCQVAALQYFLDHEDAVCANVIDAAFRWQQLVRIEQSDWFHECPQIRSKENLGKILEVRSLTVMAREVEGLALVVVYCGCEWDPEHGLGLLLLGDQVIEDYYDNYDVRPDGRFSRMGTAAEKEARARYLNVFPYGEEQGEDEDHQNLDFEAMIRGKFSWNGSLPDRENLLAELRGGKEGIAQWNARPIAERASVGSFSKLDLSGLHLDGAILGGLDFQKTKFDRSSLRKATLTGGDFRNCSLKGVVFSGLTDLQSAAAKFDGSDFTEADLSCIFASFSCKKCEFAQADLKGSTFRSADFRNSTFAGADLTDVQMLFAKLQGADLSGANLTRTKIFSGSQFDEGTLFPRDFPFMSLNRVQLQWKGKGEDPRRRFDKLLGDNLELLEDPSGPEHILTVPGTGWSFSSKVGEWRFDEGQSG